MINRLFKSQAKFCPLVVSVNSRVGSLRLMPYLPHFFQESSPAAKRLISYRGKAGVAAFYDTAKLDVSTSRVKGPKYNFFLEIGKVLLMRLRFSRISFFILINYLGES